jgi:hypothetical protein
VGGAGFFMDAYQFKAAVPVIKKSLSTADRQLTTDSKDA